MNDDLVSVLTIRLVGAVAGTILALGLTPPLSRRGFYQRAVTAMIFGPVFAGQVHNRFGFFFSPDADGMIAATCLTSLVSWQIMTVLKRAASAWQAKVGVED